MERHSILGEAVRPPFTQILPFDPDGSPYSNFDPSFSLEDGISPVWQAMARKSGNFCHSKNEWSDRF